MGDAIGPPFICDLDVLFPCEECKTPTDPEWWFRADRLCGDCLANYAMPLTRIEPQSNLVRCTDPDCDVAWAYRDPPTEHWHPRPHGPERPDG